MTYTSTTHSTTTTDYSSVEYMLVLALSLHEPELQDALAEKFGLAFAILVTKQVSLSSADHATSYAYYL